MSDMSQYNRPRPATYESTMASTASHAGSFEGKATDFVRDLGDAARRNPLSTALIGMGLLWLMTGGGPVRRANQLVHGSGLDRLPEVAADAYASGRSALSSGVDTLTERFSDLSDSASSMADAATRSVRDSGGAVLDRATRLSSDLVESASSFGRTIPARGNDLLSEARNNLSTMFNQQPLLLGAVGLAIGAGIAASLRTTELEATYLGEVADELKAKASGFVAEQTEHVQSMVKDAASQTMEEARRQGLTPEALKAAASGIGDKAKQVAQATGDNIGRIR